VSTVFLCRDGAAARYLAHELAQRGLVDAIVAETGRAARQRKLRRELDRTRWWRLPFLALDLAALAVYGRLWSRALDRRLAGHPAASGYPEGIPLWSFDDANGADCVARLRESAPDVLVVFGTSILRAPVLSIAKRTSLNVHGGLVPAYRNVHSEVWAVLAGDERSAGTSILHLDEGIDSGAVALAGRVQHAEGFFDLRWRNLELSAALLVEALEREREGTLAREPQGASESGFWPTPGLGALVRLLFRRVRF
jgi:hypothetical protein